MLIDNSLQLANTPMKGNVQFDDTNLAKVSRVKVPKPERKQWHHKMPLNHLLARFILDGGVYKPYKLKRTIISRRMTNNANKKNSSFDSKPQR